MQSIRCASIFRSQVFARGCRQFHLCPRLLINVGDAIPDIEVQEGSPGNKISIAKELKGKALIVGVPGAFSPACSEGHMSGYLENASKLPQTFIVGVNDAFVMKAWSKALPGAQQSKIRFVADPAGKFTKAMGMNCDLSEVFGSQRSRRYAIIVEDGKAKKIFAEPDNTGIDVSKAANVLASLD